MLSDLSNRESELISPWLSQTASTTTSYRPAITRVPVPTSQPFTPPPGLARLRAGARLGSIQFSTEATDPNWQPPSSILSVLSESHDPAAKVENKATTRRRSFIRRPFLEPASPRTKKFHLDLSFLDEAPPPPAGSGGPPTSPSATWANRLSRGVDALTRITTTEGTTNEPEETFDIGTKRARTRSRFFTKKITFPSKARRAKRESVALPPPLSPARSVTPSPPPEPEITKRSPSITAPSFTAPSSYTSSLLSPNGPLPSPSPSDHSSHSSIHESDLIFLNSRKALSRDSLDTFAATFDWQLGFADDEDGEKGRRTPGSTMASSPSTDKRKSIHIQATPREYREPLVEIPKIPHTKRPIRISIAPRPLSEVPPRHNPRLSLGPLPYPPPAAEVARGTIYYTPSDKMDDLAEEAEYPLLNEEDEGRNIAPEGLGLGVHVGDHPLLTEDVASPGGDDAWEDEPITEDFSNEPQLGETILGCERRAVEERVETEALNRRKQIASRRNNSISSSRRRPSTTYISPNRVSPTDSTFSDDAQQMSRRVSFDDASTGSSLSSRLSVISTVPSVASTSASSIHFDAEPFKDPLTTDQIQRRRATYHYKAPETMLPLIPSGEDLGMMDMIARTGRRASGW